MSGLPSWQEVAILRWTASWKGNALVQNAFWAESGGNPMIQLTDGPAGGRGLLLKRAPVFLRIVIAPDGTVDGLDQPGDKPEPTEAVFAYVRTSENGVVHLSGKNVSGFYPIATYQLQTPPLPESILRNRASWEQWANAEYNRRKGEAT
jgi:hypothetical protein